MNKSIKIKNDLEYYINYEPDDPKELDIVVYEDNNYIRGYIFIGGEWLDIIDVVDEEKEYVKITYSFNSDISDDIESMEYLYRTGIVL
jgi:hypothetical protein